MLGEIRKLVLKNFSAFPLHHLSSSVSLVVHILPTLLLLPELKTSCNLKDKKEKISSIDSFAHIIIIIIDGSNTNNSTELRGAQLIGES